MAKHWYYRSGDEAYQIPKADGNGMKSPTITDAKQIGLVPSVTTIISDTQHAERLQRWKMWRVLKTAYGAVDLANQLEFNQWSAAVQKKAFSSGEEGADLGTQIHAVIESILRNEDLPDYEMELAPEFFFGFSDWWNNSGLTAVSIEHKFAHPIGYGGKMDLVAYDEDDRDVFVDWKTKNTRGKTIKDFMLPEQPKQLAAYAKGWAASTRSVLQSPRIISVYVSRDEQGRVEEHEWDSEMFEDYWEAFLGLLVNWKLDNKYDPCFYSEEEQ